MKPTSRYLRRRCRSLPAEEREKNESFWAHVRTISEELDYTDSNGDISAPANVTGVVNALKSLRLAADHIVDAAGSATAFGQSLLDYLQFRAKVLNEDVKPKLMDKDAAKQEFIRCCRKYRPNPLSFVWNKQAAAMKAPAFLTCTVNMVLAHVLGETSCDFDPQSLTTVTAEKRPFRTLARRVDGAYPQVVNPTAVWEIKEYYYTTSFGSRIADGIYESLLDGLELEDLEQSPHGKIFHYLIIDAAETWWGQGNPYLCRVIDMLHMGYLDEAIFGNETETALAAAAQEWRAHREAKLKGEPAQAQEEVAAGLTPPPKHKRLAPADRRKRAQKWNEWAQKHGISEIVASAEETVDERNARLAWNRQRKGLPPKKEGDAPEQPEE